MKLQCKSGSTKKRAKRLIKCTRNCTNASKNFATRRRRRVAKVSPARTGVVAERAFFAPHLDSPLSRDVQSQSMDQPGTVPVLFVVVAMLAIEFQRPGLVVNFQSFNLRAYLQCLAHGVVLDKIQFPRSSYLLTLRNKWKPFNRDARSRVRCRLDGESEGMASRCNRRGTSKWTPTRSAERCSSEGLCGWMRRNDQGWPGYDTNFDTTDLSSLVCASRLGSRQS